MTGQNSKKTTLREFIDTTLQNRKAAEKVKSYGEWLSEEGSDPAAAYREEVDRADDEYRRSGAYYGASGESLGQAGLGGSGYGAYLNGQRYAAWQKRLSEAYRTYRADEDKSRSRYADYLAGEREAATGRTDSALSALLNRGVTDYESAMAYALQSGVGEEDARNIATIAVAMNGETKVSAATRRTLAEYIAKNNLSRSAAVSYAMACGMSEEEAEEFYRNACNINGGYYSGYFSPNSSKNNTKGTTR